MDGTRLFIEAVTRTQADGDHRRGVEQIVEPIRFEYELSHSPFRVVASAGAAEQLLLRWTRTGCRAPPFAGCCFIIHCDCTCAVDRVAAPGAKRRFRWRGMPRSGSGGIAARALVAGRRLRRRRNGLRLSDDRGGTYLLLR